MKKEIYIKSQEDALRIMGVEDKRLRIAEEKFNVHIDYNYNPYKDIYVVRIRGNNRNVIDAYRHILEGNDVTEEKHQRLEEDVIYFTISGKPIKPCSHNQKIYIESIKKNDIVIAIGPAGTGKTFLAVSCALAYLDAGKVIRIVLTRPVIEAGEKLGYLPGDIYEKVDPYLKPLYDAFFTLLGMQKFKRYKDEKIIEIIPLAYMRGRTIDNAFIILDEAQNTVAEQMKMFLTRLGNNSKAVITGDITQIDLEDKSKSGLVLSQHILKGIKGISFCYLTEEDVVRHPLVKKIIIAYELWEKNIKKSTKI